MEHNILPFPTMKERSSSLREKDRSPPVKISFGSLGGDILGSVDARRGETLADVVRKVSLHGSERIGKAVIGETAYPRSKWSVFRVQEPCHVTLVEEAFFPREPSSLRRYGRMEHLLQTFKDLRIDTIKNTKPGASTLESPF